MNQIAHDEIMELQESLKLLRRRNNVLAAEIEALKRKLSAAKALAEALAFIYDDITTERFIRVTFGEYREGTVLGDLALEKAEAALRQHREAQDG